MAWRRRVVAESDESLPTGLQINAAELKKQSDCRADRRGGDHDRNDCTDYEVVGQLAILLSRRQPYAARVSAWSRNYALRAFTSAMRSRYFSTTTGQV